MKIFLTCAATGLGSAVVAQVVPPTSGSPWAIAVASIIGIIGTAIAHFWYRLQTGAIKGESQRLDETVKWYRNQLDILEKRATAAEIRASVLQTKLDVCEGRRSSDQIPSSRPPSASG